MWLQITEYGAIFCQSKVYNFLTMVWASCSCCCCCCGRHCLKSTMFIPWDLVLLRSSSRVWAFDEAEFGVRVECPEKSSTCSCTEICTCLLIFHSFAFVAINVEAVIGDIVFYEATCEEKVTMYTVQSKSSELKRAQAMRLFFSPTFSAICWFIVEWKSKILTGTGECKSGLHMKGHWLLVQQGCRSGTGWSKATVTGNF